MKVKMSVLVVALIAMQNVMAANVSEYGAEINPVSAVEVNDTNYIGGENIVEGAQEDLVLLGTDNAIYGEGTLSTTIIGSNNEYDSDSFITSIGNNNIGSGESATIVGSSNYSTGEYDVVLGTSHTVESANGTAIGYGNSISESGQYSTVIGTNSHNSGEGNLILGNDINVDSKGISDAVVLGNKSVAAGSNTVSIGSQDNTRKLVHLKAGDVSEDSTEAINGSQLYEIKQDIIGDKNTIYQNAENINAISSEISTVRSDMENMGAHSAALSALKPLQYNPNERAQIMAATGHYKGNNAFALGLAVHSNEDFMFNGGLSFGSGSDVMLNAGMTWRIGESDSNGITNVGEDNSEVSKLQNEIKDLKTANEILEERVARLEKQMEALLNK